MFKRCILVLLVVAPGCGTETAETPDGARHDALADFDATGNVDATAADARTTSEDANSTDAAETDASVSSNVCQAAGGLCLAGGGMCIAEGGVPLPQGDPGCVFSDGPGTCCAPPPAAPTGDSCTDRGGLCAPLSGCNFVNGSFAPADPPCNHAAIQLCCVPQTVCGPELVECCDESGPTSYRPVCDRGTFNCSHIPGTTMMAEGMCGS